MDRVLDRQLGDDGWLDRRSVVGLLGRRWMAGQESERESR